MSDVFGALGAAGAEYGLWVGLGAALLVIWLVRRADSSDAQQLAAVQWVDRVLEQAPDKLYVSVHPNWSVYRKQLKHQLRSDFSDLADTLLEQVLAGFDCCYELSDGVYIRTGSVADDTRPQPITDFTPLIAPVENFRLQKVQARRRWRTFRTVTFGVVVYLAVVLVVLSVLVLVRGAAH